jgi:hypothetical protein
MGDAATPHFVAHQLYLGSFATVYQKLLTVECHHLAGRVPVECRDSGIITKDRNG